MKDSMEARIGRYLAGEMDEQEMREFQREMASDPALEEACVAYRLIWQIKPSAPAEHWDEDRAWVDFGKKNFSTIIPLKSKRNVAYWSIAASVIILVAAAFYYLSLPATKTYLYSDAASSIIDLPDGSKVHLNKGSSITVYPFNHQERHLALSGEAFFEVSPDPKRPFTITCGKTQTEVVGTTFDIKQLKEQVQLFVNTGKVIFRSVDNTQTALALNAGEAAYFENNKMQMVPNPSPNANAWHTKELRLYKLTIEQAIKDVAEYFGKNIAIENPDIKSCVFSGSLPFNNPEIQNVLNAIARSINAKMIVENDKYIIKGGNCL